MTVRSTGQQHFPLSYVGNRNCSTKEIEVPASQEYKSVFVIGLPSRKNKSYPTFVLGMRDEEQSNHRSKIRR